MVEPRASAPGSACLCRHYWCLEPSLRLKQNRLRPTAEALQRGAYVYFEDEHRPTISGQDAHQRRGAAHCGEYRKAAGPIAQIKMNRAAPGKEKGPGKCGAE